MSKSKSEKQNREEYSSTIGYSLKDVFGAKPHIEVTGNNYAVIDGCRGILEYTDTEIRVSLGALSLQINGRGLNLKCISPTSVIIEGFILSFEYIN